MNYKKTFSTILILCLTGLFTINCGNQTSAQQNAVQNTKSENLNSNKSDLTETNNKHLEELEKQNAKFRQVPDEWKNVDFKNYNYTLSNLRQTIRLKDSHYEYQIKNGGGWVDLDDVFFFDIIGDDKKEAVVMLNFVVCGGSCDGGTTIINIYNLKQEKPKVFWLYETGTNKSGCGLKSFTIKDKKITIEQFGNCLKNSNKDLNWGKYLTAFQSKDITKTVFSFVNNKLRKESNELIETETIDLRNSKLEIRIS